MAVEKTAASAQIISPSLMGDPMVMEFLRYWRQVKKDIHALTPLIIMVVIAAIIGSLLWFLSSPPVSKASAIIRIDAAGSGSEKQSDIDTEVRVLESIGMMEQTIINLPYPADMRLEGINLIDRLIRYINSGEDGQQSLMPSIRFSHFNTLKQSGIRPFYISREEGEGYSILTQDKTLVAKGTLGQKIPLSFGVTLNIDATTMRSGQQVRIIPNYTEDRILTLMNRHLKVEKVGLGSRANLIKVSFNHWNRAYAEDFLKYYVSTYQEHVLGQSSAPFRQALEHAEQELATLKNNMRDAQDVLNEFYARENVVDLTAQSKLNLQRLVEIEESILNLKQKITQSAIAIDEGHPAMQAMRKQMQTLMAERATLQKKTYQMPQLEQELFRYSFDLKNITRLYEMALENKARLQNQIESVTGYASIVKAPRIDNESIASMSLASMMAALIATLFIFAVTIAVRNIPLLVKLEDVEQLQGLTSLTAFSVTMPLPDGRRALPPPARAAFSRLAAHMPALAYGKSNHIFKIMHVTDATHQSGFTYHLATHLAESGKKILLIDADLVQQRLTRQLGYQDMPGFSELIMDIRPPEETLLPPKEDHRFCFIPAGASCLSYRLLVQKARQKLLMRACSSAFDHVLIDVPPHHGNAEIHEFLGYDGTIIAPIMRGIPLREVAYAAQAVHPIPQGGMMMVDIPQRTSILSGLFRKKSA